MVDRESVNNPAFSVSMCVYGGDHPEHFKDAVESILNQTVPPNEVVLVVDGPVPEELDEVIHGFESDIRFHVIRLEQNQGHGNARRLSLDHCRNELVALMDADDLSVPDRFERQLKAFERTPEVSIVGGNISEFINDFKDVIGYRTVPSDDISIKEYMKRRCPFNQVTVMFRKPAVQNAGGYIDWFCEEDYYLWLRMYLNNALFSNLDNVLVHVRTGIDYYQRRGEWKYFLSEAKLQKYMLDKHIINLPLFCINVLKRFLVQVMMPNDLRGWAFRKFARRKDK